MENPGLAIHRIPKSRSSTARYVGAAFVGALHVIAIYALANGLAIRLVHDIPKLIETKIIQPPPKPKEQPPPAPEVKLQAPPKIQTFVPPPDIKIETPPPPAAIQQVQKITPAPPTPPPKPAPVTPPAPPPPAPTIPDSEAVGIASTHTTPPYPPVAHRLEKEGTVMLHIAISASGDVTDASVSSSSGTDELDQAAIEWVKSHWRYKPAIHNGQPVASTANVAVKFTLKNAQ